MTNVCGGTLVLLQKLSTSRFRGLVAADAVRALGQELDTALYAKLRGVGVASDHAFFLRITLAMGEDGSRGRADAHFATLDGISDLQLAVLLRSTDESLSFYSRHAATFFGRRQREHKIAV